MRLVFYLIDKNDRYEIARANEVTGEFGLYILSDYIELEVENFELYEYVKNLLDQNRQCFLPKYDFNKTYDISDVILIEESDLDIVKRIAIKRVNNKIYGTILTKLHLIDIYDFTVLNNYFVDKGFVITDDNRESKYLDIISYISDIEDENEAEDCIDKLQEYLNAKDRIEYAKNVVNDLRIYEQQINDATTEEEVNNLYNEYIARFGH